MVAATRKRTRESKHGTREKTKRAIEDVGLTLAPESYSESEFEDVLLRSRWDLKYFAEKVLGITPHPGQERLWDAILKRDKSGFRPRNLTICCSAGNRAGKTLGIAIPILHSAVFKHGLKPPNPWDQRELRRWMDAAYEWYHFAIAQETSELVYIELTRILAGTHEAQGDGCPLTKWLGNGVAETKKKYRGEYLWIKLHPLLGGADIHFRTTGERAIGSLGKDMNGISYDECGFDPHFEFIVDEVLHMRRLSTGGQLILISTPTEGLTAFADKWYEGDPEAPDRKQYAYSLRMSTRENVGYGIDPADFERLLDGVPEAIRPQNIDGLFLEGTKAFFSQASVDAAFVSELEEVQSAVSGHRYVQGVDPALTFDSTWSIVLDASASNYGVGVRAEQQRGRTTGPVIAALATNAHNAYKQGDTSCETAIDATGFGGAMFRDLLYIKPLVSIEFGGTRAKKLRLLNDVKLMLEKGQLKFPRKGVWLKLRRQLLGYRLDDRDLETDGVMALAVAVAILRRSPPGAVQALPFDYFHPSTGAVPLPSLGGPRALGRVASYASLSDLMRDSTGGAGDP